MAAFAWSVQKSFVHKTRVFFVGAVPLHRVRPTGVRWIKCAVAVCCSVLQCVAVCCSVLQCVAVCCSVLQCVAVWFEVIKCAVAVCCSVLQCVAVCCSVVWGRSKCARPSLSGLICVYPDVCVCPDTQIFVDIHSLAHIYGTPTSGYTQIVYVHKDLCMSWCYHLVHFPSGGHVEWLYTRARESLMHQGRCALHASVHVRERERVFADNQWLMCRKRHVG